MYCSNAVGLILLCGLVVISSISPPNLLIEEYHSLAAFDNNSTQWPPVIGCAFLIASMY